MSGFGRSAFRAAWGSSRRWLGAATAGSFAYGSMMVVQQEEHKPFKSAVDLGNNWRLEYPEKKVDEVMLARKVPTVSLPHKNYQGYNEKCYDSKLTNGQMYFCAS
jgi:hypothetical protein